MCDAASIPHRKRQRRLFESVPIETVEKVQVPQLQDSWEGASDASRHGSPSGVEEGSTSIEDDGYPAEDSLACSGTELETTLPPVESGRGDLDDYGFSEEIENNHSEPLTLQERYNDRKWTKGRSSIYVDAFNLALESVLADESHLFNEPERALFDYWRDLPYESQYLYVRLFLRKSSAWHRIGRLGYYDDIADLPGAVADLRQKRHLPASCLEAEPNPSGLAPPPVVQLEEEFQFADGLDQLTSLEDASSLLLLEELKGLAKESKVQGRTKKDILKALRDMSNTQTELPWNKTQRDGNDDSQTPETSNGAKKITTRDEGLFRKILVQTGDCIRLSPGPFKLFERVHLVFYRSTEWTENSLTAIILAKISRKNYPEYIVSRSSAIFPTRLALLEFEAALRIQHELDNTMESSNLPMAEKLKTLRELAEGVCPRWRALVTEEHLKEERLYETGEGAYLRRFSPAWVYTRIIHKGLYALGRFKEYNEEHELLSELLDQRLFHLARRGAWFQRKALLEEHYMWTLAPSEGRSDDAQKREWKGRALRTCEQGLEDPDCHLIYHYDLQKRINKLERSLKVVKREQHDFGHVMLAKPAERTVRGIRIESGTPINSTKANGEAPSRKAGPTTWIDEREGGGECRVESMCLSWYRDNGWKGFHCERGILRTLFGYLFYDILFGYAPNVFQTPFQTCPLDLHTDSFYATRASEINRRLAQISNGHAENFIRQVHEREFKKQTCIIGVDWTFELDDLLEIAQCFRGEALAAVCKVMAQEYQQRGSGVPDLFLWSMETKEVMFAEVKSENDRLSDTQRLWIHVLTGAGVRVELCNAVAREVRYI